MIFRTALVLLTLAVPLVAQPPGPVVFSELMWMGSTASSADEWIELYNQSDAEKDLAGWTITRLNKDEEQVMLRITEGIIPSRSTFLIANYAPENSRSKLAVQPQLVDAAVALPNTKLQLRLYDGDPEAGGKLVDEADDGTGAPLAGETDLKYAMVRIAFDQAGTLPTSWATAQQASGWDEGATERGTPGEIPDYLGAVPVEEQTGTLIQPTTWATIKNNPELALRTAQ